MPYIAYVSLTYRLPGWRCRTLLLWGWMAGDRTATAQPSESAGAAEGMKTFFLPLKCCSVPRFVCQLKGQLSAKLWKSWKGVREYCPKQTVQVTNALLTTPLARLPGRLRNNKTKSPAFYFQAHPFLHKETTAHGVAAVHKVSIQPCLLVLGPGVQLMSSHRAQASRGGRDHRRKRLSFQVSCGLQNVMETPQCFWMSAVEHSGDCSLLLWVRAGTQVPACEFSPLKGAPMREAKHHPLSLESVLPKAFVSESSLETSGDKSAILRLLQQPSALLFI